MSFHPCIGSVAQVFEYIDFPTDYFQLPINFTTFVWLISKSEMEAGWQYEYISLYWSPFDSCGYCIHLHIYGIIIYGQDCYTQCKHLSAFTLNFLRNECMQYTTVFVLCFQVICQCEVPNSYSALHFLCHVWFWGLNQRQRSDHFFAREALLLPCLALLGHCPACNHACNTYSASLGYNLMCDTKGFRLSGLFLVVGKPTCVLILEI